MNEKNPTTRFTQPEVLKDQLQSGAPVMLIDVRSADEFKAGHIDGALNIPADHLHERVDEIAKDKPIVTVCTHGGRRSCGAAEQLQALGFRDVTPLQGGVHGWIEKKF